MRCVVSQVVREYDEAEKHYAAALARTDEALRAARDRVTAEQTVVKAAGAAVPPSPHLPSSFLPATKTAPRDEQGGWVQRKRASNQRRNREQAIKQNHASTQASRVLAA